MDTTTWRKEERESPFLLDRWGDEKHEHALIYDIEYWYENCKSFTFDTRFLPISLEEGKAIIEADRHYSMNIVGSLDENVKNTISALEGKLKTIFDDIKQSNSDSNAGFFVRLSSRSPKDAGMDPHFQDRIISHLIKLMDENPVEEYYKDIDITQLNIDKSPIDDSYLQVPWKDIKLTEDLNLNLKLLANYHNNMLYKALGDILCVHTSSDIIDLLTYSERSYLDLLYEMKYPDTWKMQIVIRNWDKRVSIDLEFRVFVCCGIISGISQYNPYAFYPNLQGREVSSILIIMYII